MLRDTGFTGAYAGVLVGVLGAFAWATGSPLVFPSLGPTAFLLARSRTGAVVAPRRVIGGHAVGVVAGLAAHWLVAPGVSLSVTLAPFSTSVLRMAVAGGLSVAATSVGMLAADVNHPPACATTLIVSLGILPSPRTGAIILAAVTALVGFHQLALRAWATFDAATSESMTIRS